MACEARCARRGRTADARLPLRQQRGGRHHERAGGGPAAQQARQEGGDLECFAKALRAQHARQSACAPGRERRVLPGVRAMSSPRMPPRPAAWRPHSQATPSRWCGNRRADSRADSTKLRRRAQRVSARAPVLWRHACAPAARVPRARLGICELEAGKSARSGRRRLLVVVAGRNQRRGGGAAPRGRRAAARGRARSRGVAVVAAVVVAAFATVARIVFIVAARRRGRSSASRVHGRHSARRRRRGRRGRGRRLRRRRCGSLARRRGRQQRHASQRVS